MSVMGLIEHELTFPAPKVLSANSSWCLSACVTTSARCSLENLNVSVFLPFLKQTVNSAPCPATGSTETTSVQGHWLVASIVDGLSVATWVFPSASTRLYFPFQECFVTRNDGDTCESDGPRLPPDAAIEDDGPEPGGDDGDEAPGGCIPAEAEAEAAAAAQKRGRKKVGSCFGL